MNTLNNDELSLIKELNSNQIINSTLDITDKLRQDFRDKFRKIY